MGFIGVSIFGKHNLLQHKLDITIHFYYKNMSVKIYKGTYFWILAKGI